jgi:signal peptidase I
MKLISNYNYIGPSMQPLFRPGDGIIVDAEVKFSALTVGDIICYPKPDTPTITVVHRIVGFNNSGEAITRGDNNSECDPYTITEKLKPQLVVKLKRGSRTIKVANGRRGMLVHRKNLITRQIRNKLFPLMRTLCLMIAKLKLFYWLKLYDNKVTFRTFKRQQREDQFIILNNRRIGHRRDDGSWHIRFPWRFFINPEQINKLHQCKQN